MNTIGFIVTQGGLPCTLYNASASKHGGVLVPGAPVVIFGKRRDASRAIGRTQRVARALDGSLVADWIKLSPLQSGQPYEITPCCRSHTGAGARKEEV